jgi:threonylcarbamoyladenosine tRNA methylthiotransferase MtaB
MAPHSSSPKNVRFYTLGCKVNQYETQGMREALERKGYRDIEGQKGVPCDLVVVNTCTVTQDADRTNRYWIRRLRREHPGARLAVTGCYAEKNRSELEAMSEVDLILSNREKPFLAEKLLGHSMSLRGDRQGDVAISLYKNKIASPSFLLSQENTGARNDSVVKMGRDPVTSAAFMPLSISRSEGKTRAFVKIQDGCNHACSFCKVSIVRGNSRSRAPEEILEEVTRLRDAGYREIILTGIQLGAYGLDLGSSANSGRRPAFEKGQGLPLPARQAGVFAGRHYFLRDVIEACARVEGIDRIRLSSIELTDLGQPLRDAFRDVPKLCPHIHLPLQSGDNEVLSRMNRRYTREEYRDVILQMKDLVPDFEFSVDVMAGFPGETEEQFENSLDLLNALRPLKCHVFPYSRREGTRAADWKVLSPQVVRERVRRLTEAAGRISAEVRGRYLGRTLEILAEHENERTGISEGFTPNYLKVFFEYPQNVQGCIIPFKLTEIFQDGFRGIPGEPQRNTGRAS